MSSMEDEIQINNLKNFKKCKEIIDELKDGQTVQQNAAYLMNFLIQDLLDFA